MSEQQDTSPAGGRAPERSSTGRPQPKVGVVLVSHSREVADSVARLTVALAAGGESGLVEGAGGGPDGGLGTSAELISAAAHKVDTGAGVALLVDLGSAVLTVKALLAEGDELPENAQLVDAPLVEGAIAAVVAAAGGAGLAEVAAAAEEAYHFRKV